MRFPLWVVVILAACATPEEQARRQEQERQQRERAIALQQAQLAQKQAAEAARMAEWHSLCATPHDPPRTYKQEMGCGWFRFTYDHAESAAILHWAMAAQLAETKTELCPAVIQVESRSAHPSTELAGLDDYAVAACLNDRRAGHQAQAEASRARQDCLEECRREAVSCFQVNEVAHQPNANDPWGGARLGGSIGCAAGRKSCNDHCPDIRPPSA